MNLKSLANDLRNLLNRGVVRLVSEALKMRGLQVAVLDGELIDPVEHPEPYGFSSAVKPGTEAFLAFLNDDRSHAVALIVADRRFRPINLQSGEIVIYDAQGQEVRLTRQGIVVKGAGLPVTITNTRKVTVDAPQSEFTGNLLVRGNLTVAGVGKGQNGGMRLLGGLVNAGGSIVSNAIALESHLHREVAPGFEESGPPVIIGLADPGEEDTEDDDSGAGQDGEEVTLVIMINANDTGHAGMMLNKGAAAILYDPNGSYKDATRGSGDAFYGEPEDFVWSDYIAYHLEYGPAVAGYEFTIPAAQAQIIKSLIWANDNSGEAAVAQCTIIISDILNQSGGVFSNLLVVFWPHSLGSALAQLPNVKIINYGDISE